MEISPYTGRPMTPIDAPLPADQRRGGYTSEGDRENAETQARNETLGIDVPASRARFARKRPAAPLAELAATAVEAHDGWPLNVLTPAETAAALEALTAVPTLERVLSLSGARVHRRTPDSGLTLCGRQVSGGPTTCDGADCADCLSA